LGLESGITTSLPFRSIAREFEKYKLVTTLVKGVHIVKPLQKPVHENFIFRKKVENLAFPRA